MGMKKLAISFVLQANLTRANVVRAFSCLLISSFVLTQCAFAVANDAPAAPALSLGSSGAPVLNVNLESLDHAQAERQVRDEEEKKAKEKLEESKIFPSNDNPLSLFIELLAKESKKENVRPSNDKEKEEENKQPSAAGAASSVVSRGLSLAPIERSASIETSKTSSGIITPPFFASSRELTVKEEKVKEAKEEDRRVEQKKNEKKERENERSIIEEAKKIVNKITSDDHRGRVSDKNSDYLPVSNVRRDLKPIIEGVMKDNKPGALKNSPTIVMPLSNVTPMPGGELTTPVPDSAARLSSASAESNADRSNLLLMNPQAYTMPLSDIVSSIVRMLSGIVSMTGNSLLMGSTESLFAHSIELLKQDIAQALLQMADLQNAVEQLSQEQRDISQEFDAEVALVNKFAKALAGRSGVTKNELKKIIASARPVFMDDDYLLQSQSMLVYIETQLTKLKEIQTRRAQSLELLKMASADPKELKAQLKETSQILIDAQVLKSLVNATKTQLLEVFRDLQKSQERLRKAVEQIREFRSEAVEDLTKEAGAAKDHIYFVYASSMEVREQTDELNSLREKIRVEAKNNYAAIVEYYELLRQIDTSILTSPAKEEIETLRNHAEKLIPEKEHGIIEESLSLAGESVWENILLRASNIELTINANLTSPANQNNFVELFEQLKQVVAEAEHLAASELKYADNAEIETRNTEALARGLAQKLKLFIGYSQEIENLLAQQGILVDLVN